MRRPRRPLPLLCVLPVLACTTFSSVRSAAPPPGLGVHVQAAIASRPGDEAAWFWSFDCANQCDRTVSGAEVITTYGLRGPDASAARATIGIGLTGFSPTVEAYWRIGGAAARPYGVGARVAIFDRWVTYNVFGRADFAVRRDTRLLWNPGIVLHTGTSPNRSNDGTFLGLVQAVGFEGGEGPWRVRPSVSFVLGRAEHTSDGRRSGPATRGFATASIGVGYERGRR